ncbi:deleted in azoospermia protein 4-like [Hydractinia symbiolongicarpus]|uniref:deleted in azoospermia protein 4-like n=1 Tax=Hydractinia symbiolongicarpus TaxID=13093 RepID=UPI00254FE505|nr:deleted in azoospermia protein 4-like [Hydractinia symbiolongicarpus]
MKFPKRLFVGGLAKNITAKELAQYFQRYGTVVEAKIILNKFGASKGYGFVSFAGQCDVSNVLKHGQLFLNGQKLNLGPAVRKQVPDVQGEPVLIYSPARSGKSLGEKSPPHLHYNCNFTPQPYPQLVCFCN